MTSVTRFVRNSLINILEEEQIESFMKMNIKDQILGLKVFAVMSKNFEAMNRIEEVESFLNSSPTMD